MKKIFRVSVLMGMAIIPTLSYSAQVNNPNQAEFGSAKPKFEVSLGPLYLQPSSSVLDYAVLGYPLPAQSPHWDVVSVEPDYSLGFALAGRYFFNDKNDIHVSWDHLSTSDSDTTVAGSSQFVVLPFQTGPSAGQSFNDPSTHAQATVSFNYDIINLDVGHYLDLTSNTQLRLYAGLSAGQIKQELDTTFRDAEATYSVNMTNNSKFEGIGPLFGTEVTYTMAYGFGLFAGVNCSALIGTIDPLTTFTSSSPELAADGIASNAQSISPDNITAVVPGFDGKLALNYTRSLFKNTKGTVSLGYEYAAYMNAIEFYSPSTVFGNVNTGTIALASLEKTTSNFSVQGPFLNFIIDFV